MLKFIYGGRVKGSGAGMMVAIMPSSVSWKAPGCLKSQD